MESRSKIILIVVISCSILVSFICAVVAIIYSTAETDPTLEFIPLPSEENAGSTLIRYTLGNYKSTEHWVDSLNEFIKPYKGRDEYNEHEEYDMKDCSDFNPAIHRNLEVCRFPSSALGSHCTPAESWGYQRSQSPCVIIKMNQVMDWWPEVYTKADIENNLLPEDMPEGLKEIIKQSAWDSRDGEPSRMVWVSCEGVNPADKEFIGDIEYTPWQGFPAYFFPYKGTPGYLSPIVAVRFIKPAENVLINIQCRPWAKNIMNLTNSGLVQFELLKD